MTRALKKRRDEIAQNARRLRLAHAILGAALAAGGAFALYDSAIAPQEDDLAALSLVVFSEIELLGGLWLLWGEYPEQTRPWTIAALAGLWAASLYHALSGKYSCGYFGSHDVNPWLFLIFVLIAMVVLLKWRPSVEDADEPAFPETPVLGLALTAVLIGVAAIWNPPLVAVAGTATFEGRPLQDASLVFVRDYVEVTVRTDHNGCFRLPPIRPGLYHVSTSGLALLQDHKPKRPDRAPTKKVVRKTRQHPAEPVRPRADVATTRRFIDEYSREEINVAF